uniref:Lipoprotein n=1 Tax=Candidatus Kentrum sp. TC TaxID=2126339 RepID=A0A451A109_9GAMM|nr:MAG: hypothetical protein BECKTC1821F_GA0114240_103614 [Candidatus Kentron sp. TC]
MKIIYVKCFLIFFASILVTSCATKNTTTTCIGGDCNSCIHVEVERQNDRSHKAYLVLDDNNKKQIKVSTNYIASSPCKREGWSYGCTYASKKLVIKKCGFLYEKFKNNPDLMEIDSNGELRINNCEAHDISCIYSASNTFPRKPR